MGKLRLCEQRDWCFSLKARDILTLLIARPRLQRSLIAAAGHSDSLFEKQNKTKTKRSGTWRLSYSVGKNRESSKTLIMKNRHCEIHITTEKTRL